MPLVSHARSADNNSDNILPVSVITTCYGRNNHLYNLLASLQSGVMQPAEVIIVNDDADKNRLNTFGLNIIQVPTTASQTIEDDSENKLSAGFDIGRNRNLGARRASYDILIFLDVDCIASADFIAGITNKIKQYPQSLIMGQPLYLMRPLTEEESQRLSSYSEAEDENNKESILSKKWLDSLSVLNPYRHNLVSKASIEPQTVSGSTNKYLIDKDDTKIEQTDDYGSFWSLCFAIYKSQFERIGGFDTSYVGYGAEDTDFAFTARKLDIDFYLTSDVVYHQQHSVYRPPLNHLNSIVINANQFFDKWRHWPMSGWLTEFADMGLIKWDNNQAKPINVLRQPTLQEVDKAHCPDAPFV